MFSKQNMRNISRKSFLRFCFCFCLKCHSHETVNEIIPGHNIQLTAQEPVQAVIVNRKNLNKYFCFGKMLSTFQEKKGKS